MKDNKGEKPISFNKFQEDRQCFTGAAGKTLGQFLKSIKHEKDPTLQYTVNAKKADDETVLKEGDFVIAIPKVKGGK